VIIYFAETCVSILMPYLSVTSNAPVEIFNPDGNTIYISVNDSSDHRLMSLIGAHKHYEHIMFVASQQQPYRYSVTRRNVHQLLDELEQFGWIVVAMSTTKDSITWTMHNAVAHHHKIND
jgi:hypothetical protein